MRSFFYILVLVAFNSLTSFGQTYTGPIPKPTSGYGSDGNYSITTQSFANINFPTHDIVVYYPAGIISPVPTIFYSHAYGGNNPYYTSKNNNGTAPTREQP